MGCIPEGGLMQGQVLWQGRPGAKKMPYSGFRTIKPQLIKQHIDGVISVFHEMSPSHLPTLYPFAL